MLEKRRQELRGKYLKLGTGELVAACVFALVASTIVMPRLSGPGDHFALWSALIPLLVILVQAGVYWLLARGWVKRAPMPPNIAGAYRAFRVINPLLLAAGLAGLLAWRPDGTGATLLVLAIWAFGVVEYFNYFVIRLSYPVNQWFTRVGQRNVPQLVQDFTVDSTHR